MLSYSTIAGLASLLLSLAVWLYYLMRIPGETVPARPTGSKLGMMVAILLGAAAIALLVASPGSPAPAGTIMGLAGIFLAGFFFWVLSLAPMPDGALVVGVGDPLPELSAKDGAGERVSSTEWRGDRVLLKFFRGSW